MPTGDRLRAELRRAGRDVVVVDRATWRYLGDALAGRVLGIDRFRQRTGREGVRDTLAHTAHDFWVWWKADQHDH